MPTSQTSIDLPVVDISQPLDHSSLSALSVACREWGFFYITNNGISKDVYKKLHSITNDIFSLSLESKLRAGPTSSPKTYTPQFIASPFYESLRVSGSDFLSSAESSSQVLFNKPNTEFSDVMQEYGTRMTMLSQKIIEIVLGSLGDDFVKKFYKKEFSKCHGYLRINNYLPPCNDAKEVEGLGMHTDMSCITIVYQDDTGGLQVRSKEGKWLEINPCEGTLVVNIGDLMQAWSNGKLRSSEHRVVLKKPVTRLSLAFFWCFEDDKVVLAPDEVVGEGKKRLYKPFLCADYMRYRENSEIGKFEKVGFTVKDFAGT
ncbi:Non-hem dioxygenase N-terminal domain [Dillenia turbinata]|uniref:Non-hem dioxygenase N-terminal domain n=1 Tax=Dillenia turbinata TaxID=194707 RepID=A0AAN8Z454_9MAGN